MKKRFSTFIFGAVVFSSSAQYHSLFGGNHTEWTVVEQNEFFEMNTVVWQNDSLVSMNGDTLYKVDRISPDFPQSIYVKEDLQLGKAWACNETNQCYLFFDLSLQVGDTLANNDALNCPQSQVDSVYWDNLGRKHIRFEQDHGIYQHFEMIEGVGTSAGLYKFVWGMISDPSMICQHKDDTLNYIADEPFVEDCEYTLGLRTDVISSISVYPNPAADEVQLEFIPNTVLSSLFLVNNEGRIVRNYTPTSSTLSLVGLTTGMYFLKVHGNTGFQIIPIQKQ